MLSYTLRNTEKKPRQGSPGQGLRSKGAGQPRRAWDECAPPPAAAGYWIQREGRGNALCQQSRTGDRPGALISREGMTPNPPALCLSTISF